MNNREMPKQIKTVLFQQIMSKLSRAKGKDSFYICMALGRGLGKKIDESQIPNFSDVCYGLYMTASTNIKEYDLQQLA